MGKKRSTVGNIHYRHPLQCACVIAARWPLWGFIHLINHTPAFIGSVLLPSLPPPVYRHIRFVSLGGAFWVKATANTVLLGFRRLLAPQIQQSSAICVRSFEFDSLWAAACCDQWCKSVKFTGWSLIESFYFPIKEKSWFIEPDHFCPFWSLGLITVIRGEMNDTVRFLLCPEISGTLFVLEKVFLFVDEENSCLISPIGVTERSFDPFLPQWKHTRTWTS